MLAKLLIGWGCTVLALLYLCAIIVGAADAYAAGGWGGFAVAVIIASAPPAVVLGIVVSNRAHEKGGP